MAGCAACCGLGEGGVTLNAIGCLSAGLGAGTGARSGTPAENVDIHLARAGPHELRSLIIARLARMVFLTYLFSQAQKQQMLRIMTRRVGADVNETIDEINYL